MTRILWLCVIFASVARNVVGIVYSDLYQLTFPDDEKSWDDAKEACEEDGSFLVKVDSDDMKDTIIANIQENRWTGASDGGATSDDEWKWLDGTPAIGSEASYTNWKQGEPNNGDSRDCAMFRYVDHQGQWNDAPCSISIKYICQKNFPHVLTFRDRTFKFYRTKRGEFQTSRTGCIDEGSRLVEIYDKETDDFLRGNILNPNALFWIGAWYQNKRVTWESKYTSDYTGWTPGQSKSSPSRVVVTTTGWKTHVYSDPISCICEYVILRNITITTKQVTVGVDNINEVTCSANGIPSSDVFWRYSSADVTMNTTERVHQVKSDGQSILYIGNAKVTDEGTYTCIAENKAGNIIKALQENLTLTVHIFPIFVFVDSEDCSSNVTVKWKANQLANVKHKITLVSNEDQSVKYEEYQTPTETPVAEMVTWKVEPWMSYTASVTPCPNDACRSDYTVSNQSDYVTSALAAKAQTVELELSNGDSCELSWVKPSDIPTNIITYKVIVNRSMNFGLDRSPQYETTAEQFLNGNVTSYVMQGKQNYIYKVGIQAKICDEFGEVVWADESCIPDTVVYLKPYQYIFRHEFKIRNNAKEDCTTRKAHLVKIDSDNITDIITANANGHDWWTGANDLDAEGEWKWLDGTPAIGETASYTRWVSPQPDNYNNIEHCGTVKHTGDWNDIGCGNRYQFICQKGPVYSDMYQLTFRDEAKTWDEAKAECEKDDSVLVKVDSRDITNIIIENINENRWIGASDDEATDENRWKWLDGTPARGNDAAFQNWKSGEPNNGGDSRDCAVIRQYTAPGEWHDVPCSNSFKYICQKNLPDTVRIGDRIFKFYRTQRVQHPGAREGCPAENSRLVEIYDKETDDLLRANILNPSAEFWIAALYDKSRSRVTWGETNKYISDYTGWAVGEPVTSGVTGLFRMVLTTKGWKIRHWNNLIAYICEFVILSNVTISSRQVTVAVNSANEVTCSANGIPSSDVFWRFSTENVTTTTTARVYQQKVDGKSVLHIRNAKLADEGSYFCIAKNNAGNVTKVLQEKLTLTVPSSPSYVFVDTEECSSSITVKWKANQLANVKHKIMLVSNEDQNVVYEVNKFPAAIPEEETFTWEVEPWMTYIASVTPCLNDVCKSDYMVSNQSQYASAALPGKSENVELELLKSDSCELSWLKPSDVPISNMTYKVIVNSSMNYRPAGLPPNETTEEKVLGGSSTNYVIQGKPNFIYNVGIQAKTCAGFGEVVWTNCTTDPRAPDTVTKPNAQTEINEEGKMKIIIDLPSQDNGQISCIFVVVRVQSIGSEPVFISEYTREALVEANTSKNGEYIAVAMPVTSLTNEISFTIGDGNESRCDAFANVSNTRRKRMATNNLFIGRNLQLNRNTDNSIFLVSTSPTNGDILLKASEALKVAGISQPGDDGNNSNTAAIGGAVGGVMLVLLALVIVFVVSMKRRRKSGKSTATKQAESQYEIIDRETQLTEEENHYEMSTDVIYENHAVSIGSKRRTETDIPMADFESTYNAMQTNDGEGFKEQFQKLTKKAKSQLLSTEFASHADLKAKNRYKNILPFDETRVLIKHNEDGYINGCFIDGFERKKKFIATQGPVKTTVSDFWLMIVEQKSSVIVMLARCVEAGRMKCEKYWPDVGKSVTFGSVTVSNANEVRLCGFIRRTLKVKAKFESGEYDSVISQYHFLKWPDHGFPITTSDVIRMHRQIIDSHNRNGSEAPIVVHCSAGAGRTGTLIGYDILLNESKSVGNADVFQCVSKMRRQRVEMVQNCDQYILVHKLVLESHIFGDTDVSRQEILEKFSNPDYKKKVSAEQFRNLSRVKPMDMTRKDKSGKISAYDRMRVKLYEDGAEITKHLSASYVEAYDDTLKIIVSKQPTEGSLDLFWKLLSNLNITAIVMITENKHDSSAYWNDAPKDGDFSVEVDSEDATPNFDVRKLKINGSGTKSVTHLHVQLNSSQAKRKTVSKIKECVKRLQKELRESHGAALIHCKNGIGMSGVFCATINILERLNIEDRVDVFRTVKDLRDCKEGMIKTEDEYELCYDSVLEYLRDFDTYSNFV